MMTSCQIEEYGGEEQEQLEGVNSQSNQLFGGNQLSASLSQCS